MKWLIKNKYTKTILFLLILLVTWEIVVRAKIFSPVIFPPLHNIANSLVKEIINGEMFIKTGYTLYLVLLGIGVSIFIAAILTVLSSLNQTARDIIDSITALVNPIPSIALLPLAILWFGIGEASMIFVIIHAVLWPILLNITAGFRSVPPIFTDIGRNIGLSSSRLALGVFLPASFPHIFVGLRTGWARAWRAAISAEMVFGAVGIVGGLGWDIYKKRSFLDVPGMYATLVVIMLIGLLIEEGLFKVLETKTVKKWGMVQ
ncbi:ABC transporter permease [Treponema primitia]|uniref:ABC transporter permease n=1 Tax=Treponema primitia TaxID=88058 RepID=UPI0002554EE7|nr:ABC transporter permease [Treponema primitia]